MCDYTYELPFSEEKLRIAALDMLRKNNQSWATLLSDCKMTLEYHGTSYYYDHARSSRWDAVAVVIKFAVKSTNLEKLENFPLHTLKGIFSDLIPAEVGYDIKEIKYIPNLAEEYFSAETAVENTMEAMQKARFAQAVEHYQQAEKQFANANDERSRKNAVRDCASAIGINC